MSFLFCYVWRGEGQALALRNAGVRLAWRGTGSRPTVKLADRVTPVGQDRPILTRSGSGDPELQT